ncbi:hypothetical protein D3C87_95600 [compost metagenome]
MKTSFDTIEYLKSGNETQKRVYEILIKHRVMERLKDFDPILTGTIPIRIDIETSDLDIVCCYPDKALFTNYLKDSFGAEDRFTLWEQSEQRAVICNFWLDGFELEIFGQDFPSRKQNAYRHMLIEHQLLEERGESFRREIIALKRQGYKTEPAFAMALGLTGNPYEELLKLEANE